MYNQHFYDHSNTFLWEQGGVAFTCIGKAANSSIKAAVLNTMGGVDPEVSVHFDDRIYYVANGYLVHQKDYPVVAFVRHPVDRLVSFWKDKIAYREHCKFEHLGFRPGMSFDAAVDVVVRLDDDLHESHISSQVSLLSHRGYVVPNRVYRFEELNDRWSEVQALAQRVPLCDLPHFNRSTKVPSPAVSDQTLAAIQERYAQDFKVFGYPNSAALNGV